MPCQRYESALALDIRVLETLQEAVGKDRCDELCRQAMVSLGDQLVRLTDAVGRKDDSATAAIAHSLSGIASSVGLEHLGREAEKFSRLLLKASEVKDLEGQILDIKGIAEEGMLALQAARPA